MILSVNSDYFLKQRQPDDFVMVKCGVSFEVRTECLNNILRRKLSPVVDSATFLVFQIIDKIIRN
jgi:hypothetical protein